MKLLLTSAGIRNETIANSLISLLNKPVAEVKVGFVSTAANVEDGNKDWFIGQFTNLYKFGFTWIDIVDISAAGVNWKRRLAEVDIVLLCGGNTFHLLDQIRKAKFDQWLREYIDSKVYVGISAGSIVMTLRIDIAGIDNGDINLPNLADLTALQFVDFEVSPHTPSNVSVEANDTYAKSITNALYAIDDNTAIVVDGNLVKVVSEGSWKKY